MSSFTISKADIKHVSDIYGLSRTYAYASDSAENSNAGFLVSNFTREEYLDLIQSLKHFYMASDNKQVVGFIFACHCGEIEDVALKNRFTEFSSRNCILVKQVCVEPKNLGSKTFQEVGGIQLQSSSGLGWLRLYFYCQGAY